MTRNTKSLVALLVVALLATVGWLLTRGSRTHRAAPTAVASRPIPSPAAREEMARMQGAWEFVSMEVDGVQKPEADFKKYSVVFKGDQWTVSEGTNIAAQTTFALDPTATPKTVDILPAPGKGAPIHGIYTLEGDKLTICDRGEDKGDRPTEFATEPDSGLVLLVFRRGQH